MSAQTRVRARVVFRSATEGESKARDSLDAAYVWRPLKLDAGTSPGVVDTVSDVNAVKVRYRKLAVDLATHMSGYFKILRLVSGTRSIKYAFNA